MRCHAPMSVLQTNRSMPESTVIPVLPYPDLAAAIEWLTAAFGFTLRLRVADHRAQLGVDASGAAVVLAAGAAAPASVLIRVPDVDAHHHRAAAAGAAILSPPTSYPYGERQFTAQDPAGHRWTFSQSIADVPPAAWGGQTAPRLAMAVLYCKDLPRLAAFYEAVFAVRPLRSSETFIELPQLGLHAIPPEIAATIAITDPPAPREDTPIKLVFSVPDLDAARARLAALGATCAVRPWGACEVVDPEGNVFQLSAP